MKDDTACDILDQRKYTFSMPYPIVLGSGAEIFLPLRRKCGVSFYIKIGYDGGGKSAVATVE